MEISILGTFGSTNQIEPSAFSLQVSEAHYSGG
jgi:hypothetical protein